MHYAARRRCHVDIVREWVVFLGIGHRAYGSGFCLGWAGFYKFVPSGIWLRNEALGPKLPELVAWTYRSFSSVQHPDHRVAVNGHMLHRMRGVLLSR